MSALVFYNTWLMLKNILISLFQEILIPELYFRYVVIAQITSLCKPNKFDHIEPMSNCLTFLFQIWSKDMDALVVEKSFYLVEKHSLLSNDNFSDLKRRSTVNAVVVLQEQIYLVGRHKKVLSLVAFDIKRIFSGVGEDDLLLYLWQNRISELLVRWIQDFSIKQKAIFVINREETVLINLIQRDLAQGSSLSLISDFFFNDTLVKIILNKNKGCLGFVKDYSACVTKSTLEKSYVKLQATVIPHVKN